MIQFHSAVQTPDGPGIVQGRITKDGQACLLVSHRPGDVGMEAKGKHWVLRTYPVEVVTEIVR